MASSATATTIDDFKRADAGFSFTGKLAEIARNDEWVEGYKSLTDESVAKNDFTSMWQSISSGTEEAGHELYVSIRNYVDNIGNIDVCGLDALRNYAKTLSYDDDNIDINFEFPKEIKALIEIFSVNRAYLFNKSASTNRGSLRGVFANWADIPTRWQDYSEDSDGETKPLDGDYIYVQNANSDAFNYTSELSETLVGKTIGRDVTTDDGAVYEYGRMLTLKDIRSMAAANVNTVVLKRTGTWKLTFNGTWSAASTTANKRKWNPTTEVSAKVLTRESIDEYERREKSNTSLYALQNTILNSNTIERVVESLSDLDKYKTLVRETFYNTLMKFINLTVGEFSVENSEISASDKIWTLNVARLTDELWDDDVTSETDIYALKQSLGVKKSFTEKIYVDDIIAGRRKLTDFDDNEQTVLKSEMESRQTRYSKDTSMKYYFMRLYKVVEYFRFTTIAFRNSYDLEDYDISTSKYVIYDKTNDSDSLLKTLDGVWSVDEGIVMKVAEWLSDYCFEINHVRERMKTKCQKNMMCGTKKLMVDMIREYLLEKIDSDTWKNFKNTTMFAAGLNKGFDVTVVEYADSTEYFNIHNSADSIDKNENSLNSRYWESNYDDGATFTGEETMEFYNKLTDSRNTFLKNSQSESGSDEPNLYDFLSNLFETGATMNSISDYGAETTTYVATDGSSVEATDVSAFDERSQDVLTKYSGDADIGKTPYVNAKNTFHPSYQLHPFINAFEEYNSAYTGVMNLVNSFTLDISDSRSRLAQRVDELGNTINFWLNWNEDFTGYSTNYEKGGNDNDSKFNQDSPFNFDALDEFLSKESYIDDLLAKTNKYYIDDSTGKFILTDDELDREVQRLRRFKSQISELSGKEIFRYGKDKYGNIYLLYKDEGNRANRDALGTMWVRIKNHPIAFPLFDLDQTQTSFSGISCLSDTDNQKLMSLLSNILVKFESDYGLNYSKNQTTRIETDNLTLSVLTHSASGIITRGDDGEIIPLEAPSAYSEYTERLTNLKFVKKPSVTITSGSDYSYYIDSVTNEIVADGTVITFKNGSRTETLTASPKPLTSEASDAFTAYFNEDRTCSFELVNGNEFWFADYDDSADTDPDTTFTYEITSKGAVMTRACSQHTTHVNSVYKISGNKISGTYDSDGNVTIPDFGRSVSRSYGYASLSSLGIKQTVDGGLLFEDVSDYSFRFKDSAMQSASGMVLDGTVEGNGNIISVGGVCNFFYSAPGYDRSGIADGDTESAGVLTSLDIYPLVRTDSARAFAFSSDSYVRDATAENTIATVYYELGDVTFSDASGGFRNDSIKQFSPNGLENFVFAPYTTITDVATSMDALEEICRTSEFSGYEGNVQTVEINGITCYYRLKTNEISGLFVDSQVMTSAITSDVSKLHGGFKLYASDYDETPISLSFYDNSSAENLMTYSSAYASKNQKKFFDFGFSYDQSRLYLEFDNGNGDNYQNSGILLGSVSVNGDVGESDLISLHRDTTKNFEFVDAPSCGKQFHVGDASNRRAVFSLFASYSDGDDGRYMTFSLYETESSALRTFNFKTSFKYALHDFGSSVRYYSAKLVATSDRLYAAFTCNTPDGDDVLSNTVNGVGMGNVGSASFSNIERYCGDSIITILSFDISELDNVTLEDDETRYIMQNGELGYFPQYSGLVGKNLMFTNSQLSSDDRFPFYAQFEPLDTTDGAFSLIDLYTVAPTGEADYGSISVSRFIDTYDANDAIRGFVFDANDSKSIYHVNLPLTSTETFSYRGLTKLSLDNDAYDISRYTDDGENNVHVLAENIDYASCTEAVSCNSICTLIEKTYVPIWSGIDGHVRTDFKELFDVSDRDFIAFHGDGYTISNARLRTRSTDDVYFVGGVADLTNVEYVSEKGESRFHSFSANGGDDGWFAYYNGNVVVSVLSDSVVTTSYLPENAANVKPFVVSDGGVSYPCAVYTIAKGDGTPFGDSIYFRRFVGVDSNGEEYGYEFTTTISTSEGAFSNADDMVVGSGLFGSATSFGGVKTIDEHSYVVLGIDSPDDTIDSEDKIDTETGNVTPATFEHTKSPIANSLFSIDIDRSERDWTVSIDVLTKSLGKIMRYSDVETVSSEVSNNGVLTIVSVNSDQSYGSIGWIDSNVAYSGSVAERSVIYDYNGEDEYTPSDVGRVYSIGNVSICDADDHESILVSTDRGKTFYRSNAAKGSKKRVVGCSATAFYAVSVDRGYVLYSVDGNEWKKALNLGDANWRVITNGKVDYAICERQSDEAVAVDESHYIDIMQQTTVYGDKPYERMFVDFDTECVVLVGGVESGGALEVAVSTDMTSFTHETFPHTDGIEYTSAYLFNGELFLSPKYSTNVLKISNLLDSEQKSVASYIDISAALGNEAVSFDGFEVVNKTLLMYPSDGRRILAYNEGSGSFVNYYTFKNVVEIADSDKVGDYPNNELIFTLSKSKSDGSVQFYKTRFTGRNDYAIVEIDNGFPILVTYEKVKTTLSQGGSEYSPLVYEFTFKFLNADKDTNVKVITTPDGYVPEDFKEKFAENVLKSKAYVSGSKSITYTFATVDEKTKYCIYKNYEVDEDTSVDEYFNIQYNLNTARRNGNLYTYKSDGGGWLSVYDGFTGFTPTEPEDFEYISKIDVASSSSATSDIAAFGKYGFTSTAEFSGIFNELKPSDNVDEHVADSNLMLMSPNTTFSTFSRMFEGCENGEFGNTLYIEQRVTGMTRKDTNRKQMYTDETSVSPTDADGMFKGCTNAAIPSANIDHSAITDMREMFSGCYNAKLKGVGIPTGAVEIDYAFKDCQSCEFEAISSLPSSLSSMEGAFYGCTKGTFANFEFPKSETD